MKKGIKLFSLKNKTALITGATGYLGESMAYILAEAGAKVLINSRRASSANELVTKLKCEGYAAESVVFDVTLKRDIDEFGVKMKDKPLHILVNNAYKGSSGNLEQEEGDNYGSSFEVGVVSAHRLLKKLLPNLRLAVQDSGDASVINLASMYGIVSPDQRIYESINNINPPFYGVTKAALIQFTRYAACEFGKEGIRINAISPGPFPSKLVQTNQPVFVCELSKKVPLGRIGLAGEIKGPVLFLASTASSYVNGANIVVDGGWTCW